MRTLALTLSLMAVALTTKASNPVWTGDSIVTGIAAAPTGGFWIQGDNYAGNFPGGSRTIALHGAPVFENIPSSGSIAAIPGGNGYWVITPEGRVYSRGEAWQICGDDLYGCTKFPEFPFPWQQIVGVASTLNGNGFWALGRDGKVYNAGEAEWYGDSSNDTQVATGFAATPSGKGYYIVHEDGGVFAFGDAVFHGSTGGKKPGGHAVTGIALSIDDNAKVDGYWLIAADGAVYTYGNAAFWGNAGKNDSNAISIVSFSPQARYSLPQRTQGYAWVLENGAVGVVYRP
jgi:hypothetical protein